MIWFEIRIILNRTQWKCLDKHRPGLIKDIDKLFPKNYTRFYRISESHCFPGPSIDIHGFKSQDIYQHLRLSKYSHDAINTLLQRLK